MGFSVFYPRKGVIDMVMNETPNNGEFAPN